MPGSATELITTLRRRWGMLEALADAEREQPELVEELDASRSTVYRGVKDLQAAGLATYGDAGYTLTTPGRVLVDQYRSFRAAVEPVAAAMDLLAALPERAAVDPAMLRDATVVTAEPPDVAAPGRRMADLISEATHVRGLFRAHTQADAADVYRSALADGLELEGVYEADFWSYLSSRESLADITTREAFVAHRIDSLPFGLVIAASGDGAETAALLVYDGDKQLRGLVVNDAPAALEWAAATYETYRDAADRVKP